MLDEEQKQQQFTRRGFVAGALGAGAAALAIGGATVLSACSTAKEREFEELVSKGVEDEDIDALVVGDEQIIETTDFDEAPSEDYLELQATWEVPLGSILHQIDSSAALVLFPGEWDETLRKIGLLNLETGVLSTIVSAPIGTSKNTVIYDARASRTALIWVELDLGDYRWKTYVAPLDGTVASDAWMVAEGDADYEPSMLAVAGNKLYWTVMPLATGAANLEDSYLRALQLNPNGNSGRVEPYTVLTSHGRMITNPRVTDGIITLVPRVDTANIYYQLTALTCENDKLVDFKVLPQSLRVIEALYADGAFSFSIENNYNYAGGLGKFGTYRDLADGNYLRMGRPPLGSVVHFGNCLLMRSITSVVGVEPAARKFFVIDVPSRSADFGESLVGWGVQDKVVTVSVRLADTDDSMLATVVRVFGRSAPKQ
ncbi:MAG: hypothetical protein LBH56_01760 [Coriobacteriales bacterium]|nr:hypothetical protein [Coriobacteriales bacterium]